MPIMFHPIRAHAPMHTSSTCCATLYTPCTLLDSSGCQHSSTTYKYMSPSHTSAWCLTPLHKHFFASSTWCVISFWAITPLVDIDQHRTNLYHMCMLLHIIPCTSTQLLLILVWLCVIPTHHAYARFLHMVFHKHPHDNFSSLVWCDLCWMLHLVLVSFHAIYISLAHTMLDKRCCTLTCTYIHVNATPTCWCP